MRTTFLQEEGWVTEMQEVGAMVLWEKEKREAWDLAVVGRWGVGGRVVRWWCYNFPTLSHCSTATRMDM